MVLRTLRRLIVLLFILVIEMSKIIQFARMVLWLLAAAVAVTLAVVWLMKLL